MTPVKQTIRLALRDDLSTEVVADVYRGLAVHRGEPGHGWKVTHVRSGLSVFRDLPTKTAAIRAVEALHAAWPEWETAGEWREAPRGPSVHGAISRAFDAAHGEPSKP